ncbi:MAG: SDR family NAD(P)-dependent oxidoreductase [bacterium]
MSGKDSNRSAVIAGVGAPQGLGAAIARRFAREGFRVTILGRSAEKVGAALQQLRDSGAVAESVIGDVTDEALVRGVVAAADVAEAPLEAAVFNAGGNWPNSFLNMDAAFLEDMWRSNALAGFFFAKAALQAMLPRQRGALLFTGATASLRGRANFGGFASAKAALRALALSAAREFGPQGIHVAHVVVDGAIDGDRINTFLPTLKAQRGADGLLDPDAIADNFWHLYCQPRSAWTHELDVRPWSESW